MTISRNSPTAVLSCAGSEVSEAIDIDASIATLIGVLRFGGSAGTGSATLQAQYGSETWYDLSSSPVTSLTAVSIAAPRRLRIKGSGSTPVTLDILGHA